MLYSVNRTLYSLHWKLHTAHWTLNTAHWALITAHWTLQFKQCSLLTTHCTLQTTHWTLHSAECTLHSAHCTLKTVHCKIHSVQCTTHTAHTTVDTVQCVLRCAQFTVLGLNVVFRVLSAIGEGGCIHLLFAARWRKAFWFQILNNILTEHTIYNTLTVHTLYNYTGTFWYRANLNSKLVKSLLSVLFSGLKKCLSIFDITTLKGLNSWKFLLHRKVSFQSYIWNI